MGKPAGYVIYRRLTVDFIDGGYSCQIPLRDIAIDADGAPDAYGPSRFPGDRAGCGTDTLDHAGYPTSEFDPIDDDWHDILVEDPHHPGQPIVKNGFYISKTSLCNTAEPDDCVPGKYVDASQVAYMVMPQFWIDHLGVALGDLCLLWHTGIQRKIVAIVADICPADEPLGEMSIAAAVALGGANTSPLTGVDFPADGRIQCMVFKRSRPDLTWPLTNAFVQSFAPALIARIAP